MISETKLAEWERLANEATPATWYTHEDDPSTIMSWEGDEYSAWEVATHVETPDADFICAAREAVPALIAEVRRLKKERTDAIAKAGTYEDFYKEAVRKLSCFDKEADWLARFLGATVHCTRLHPKCDMTQTKAEDCAKCWREAARKEVQDA